MAHQPLLQPNAKPHSYKIKRHEGGNSRSGGVRGGRSSGGSDGRRGSERGGRLSRYAG